MSVTSVDQWDDAITPLGMLRQLEPEIRIPAVVDTCTPSATLREPVAKVDVAVGPDVSHLPGVKAKPLRKPGEFRVEAGGEQVFECGPSTCVINTSSVVPVPELVSNPAAGDAPVLSKRQLKRARAREKKEEGQKRASSPRQLGTAQTGEAAPSFTV